LEETINANILYNENGEHRVGEVSKFKNNIWLLY
jgi:hypothetical protein